MSSSSVPSVEFASQETRAIQGVKAGNGCGKQGNNSTEVDARTDAIGEILFAEVDECALRFRLNKRGDYRSE